jgi:hypothetical protein
MRPADAALMLVVSLGMAAFFLWELVGAVRDSRGPRKP